MPECPLWPPAIVSLASAAKVRFAAQLTNSRVAKFGLDFAGTGSVCGLK